MPKEFLKYCKRFRLTPDEFLALIFELPRNERLKAELFKFIYSRERAQNPGKLTIDIREEMCDNFGIGRRTLEKYIYWK